MCVLSPGKHYDRELCRCASRPSGNARALVGAPSVARANILRSLHRYDEAVSAAKRAIELDPQQPNAYGVLADIAHNTGDGAGQVVWLMHAHRIDPKDHEIPTKIATALVSLGEFEAADAWIDESLRIAPGHIYPESRRVDMAFLRGDYVRARELGLGFAARENGRARCHLVLARRGPDAKAWRPNCRLRHGW